MTDQYTEISFNSGETLKASQLNTVVQNINIVSTQVENINTSINKINTVIAGKADKPAGNENYATVTYVNNSIAEIPKPDLSSYATKNYVDTEVDAITTSTLGAAKADDLNTLKNSLNLAVGTLNSFAVSDGKGGITWLKIPIAEDITY